MISIRHLQVRLKRLLARRTVRWEARVMVIPPRLSPQEMAERLAEHRCRHAYDGPVAIVLRYPKLDRAAWAARYSG